MFIQIIDKEMRKVISLFIVYLLCAPYFKSYATNKCICGSGDLMFVESGNKIDTTDSGCVSLSVVNTLFSIADYFDIYDKELYEPEREKINPIFRSVRYVPDGDSIGAYFPDDYHDNLYKIVRPIIHSNYKEIVDYINTGRPYLSYWKNDVNTITCDSYFYKYKSGKIVKDTISGLSLENDTLMENSIQWLEGFAKLMDIERFLKENESVFKDYVDSLTFDVEQYRRWMNKKFHKKYDRFLFRTSPFANPFDFHVYEINSQQKCSLILAGGVFVTNSTCDFSGRFRVFCCISDIYILEITHDFQEKMDSNMSNIKSFFGCSLFLVYCNENESKEIYNHEKYSFQCKLDGLEVGEKADVSFDDFFDEFLNKYNHLDNDKTLDDIYVYFLLKYGSY